MLVILGTERRTGPGSGTPFSIADLFVAGAEGVWLGLDDPALMRTAALGGSLVTGAGDPVGMLLDRQAGELTALEPSIAPSLTDLSDWGTPFGQQTVEAGGMRLTTTGASGFSALRKGFSGLVAGDVYRVTMQLDASISSEIGVGFGSNVNSGNSPVQFSMFSSGQHTVDFLSEIRLDGGGTCTLSVHIRDAAAAGEYVEIQSLTIQRVPGHHALQATSSQRPGWNGADALTFDGIDDALTLPTLPDLGSAATVAYKRAADGAVVYLEGQTISGAYTLPDVDAETFLIVIDRPLTAGEKAELEAL